MINFNEITPFIESVKTNNLSEIKNLLIENIFFQQGDKRELDKALQYAINNSSFKFEEHIDLEVSDKTNKEDYFSDEKWNMRENYSKERYNLLVELYNETFAKQEYAYSIVEENVNNDKLVKKVIIGSVIVIAGYLIYKATV